MFNRKYNALKKEYDRLQDDYCKDTWEYRKFMGILLELEPALARFRRSVTHPRSLEEREDWDYDGVVAAYEMRKKLAEQERVARQYKPHVWEEV